MRSSPTPSRVNVEIPVPGPRNLNVRRSRVSGVDGHLRIDLGGGAQALFTTGLDLALDAPAEHYDQLAAAIGLPRTALVQGRQVHGRVVARVSERTGLVEGVDGHATATPGLAPIVITADCLAVALAAEGAVAMVHAGWRGLAAGILEEGVTALRDVGGDGPMTAAIGPAAGVCCYEVGDEVRAAFADAPDAQQGRNIDLKAIAAQRLRAAGVTEIHDVGICTICADPERFFSHRRDGGSGRQAGVAWRS
ncbi:MAG: laccase domain-containing protein [Solirubrobacteraceae bacterium]|nr:laccase domain-containing protein [Solirubrobacteraceae bacterium]